MLYNSWILLPSFFLFSFLGKDAFSAAGPPQIAPPAPCSSKISSGFHPGSVTSPRTVVTRVITQVVVCPWPGSVPRTVELLALVIPSVSALLFGGVHFWECEGCCPPQGFWAPPSMLTQICYISFCLFTVLLPKATSHTWLCVCTDKEHS